MWERLRVVTSDAEHTIVRLVRTESGANAEQWTLLTARLPSQRVANEVFTMGYTPMELEYLQGKRELR